MTPRSRLLAPLRRTVVQDDVCPALAALFAAEAPDEDAFSAELLRKVPLERLRATVEGLRDRHGAVRGVRRQRGLYQVQFARGAELVWARVSPDGKLDTLVTGPGALTARQTMAPAPVPSQSRTDLPVLPATPPSPGADDHPAPENPPRGEAPPQAGRPTWSRQSAAVGVATARRRIHTWITALGSADAAGAAAPAARPDPHAPVDPAGAGGTAGTTTHAEPGPLAGPAGAGGTADTPPAESGAPDGAAAPPRVLVAASREGSGARGGAVALTRLALGYLAATAATAVLPYLTGTATGWLLLAVTAPALAWYVLRTGPTHALPPWFRALPVAAVALAVLAGLRALPVFGPGLPWSRPGIPELVLCAAGLGLAGWTRRRTRPLRPSPSAHPLVLSFPLRGGRFAFTEAGGPAVNRYAQASLVPGAARHRRYAVDLVQLGDGPQWRGRRALGLAPSGNERYAVFGHPVLSPCDGVVVAAVDGLPDHSPYAPATGHPEGNHIAIDTGRALVVLSWLRQDSIRVRRGQHLTAGTPVAAVGDSGDGGEPALHLRAETRTSRPTPGSGVGLPFRFTGLRGHPLRGRRLRLSD